MSFDPVTAKVSFPALETKLLEEWKKERVFERSVEEAKDRPRFVFYEGPPTANGKPHPGSVLTRVMKDVILRHRAMTGHFVPRRGGWDTHGLPVEVEVEKALGISGREAIMEYGVEAFTYKCIESVFKYVDEWRRMSDRVAFWLDMDAAYVTFHKSYVESVWWALKTLFDKGLLYQGYKIIWWWPQGGTALSAGEVGQGYKDVDDPSIFVKFAVTGEEKTAFLAWTTTPWTLPSNVALAVKPDAEYGLFEHEDGWKYWVALPIAGRALGKPGHAFTETAPLLTKRGSELVGTRYAAPLPFATPTNGRAWEVIAADFVTLDTGSGIVHVAPAFGEDDFRVGRESGMGFLQLVKPDGTFTDEVTPWKGRFCKEADRDIIRHLRDQGLLYKEEVYRHPYPFCWRKDTDPLIQYARKSWFIRTTQEIHKVIENNEHVAWEPEHIQQGRFGEFLRSNVDWALSRERFWGTPLPIWINDETGAMKAMGSANEILALNPRAFDHFAEAKKKNPELSEHLMVHKPWVDDVTFEIPGEKGVYRRVSEVIDCWFDSGCMPFAQHGYPHTGREAFEKEFPADFITEAIDQTRGWFYSLITISTLLADEWKRDGEPVPMPHPFKHCTVLGLLTDEKNFKLSKSRKNYKDPMFMFDEYGGDAVRWALFTSAVPGQSGKWFEGGASDAIRDLLLKVWNCYSFFVTYANIDGWTPGSAQPPIAERSELDRWILAELDETVRFVGEKLEHYETHPAARRVEDFVDALSNWYVRRSRSRFWGSEKESPDKLAAFSTLYEVLVDLSRLLAPFTPFLADTVYRNLTRGVAGHPSSVHLAAYPKADDARQDDDVRRDMAAVRNAVRLGLRVRMDAKLKVRQPVAEMIIATHDPDHLGDAEARARLVQVVADELNVERVVLSTLGSLGGVAVVDVKPNLRTLGPRFGKRLGEITRFLAQRIGIDLLAELRSTGAILWDGNSLSEADVLIATRPLPGHAVQAEGELFVALDTTITPELRLKGLAREAVSKIQAARKQLDLAHEARIRLHYTADGPLADALAKHAAYVQGEVLASHIINGAADGNVFSADVDGHTFTFVVELIA